MKTLRIVLIALVALAAGLVASANAQTLLLTLDTPNPQANAWFGSSLAMGDVNGDGKADIAVGTGGEDVGGNTDQGRVYAFSGADGSLLFTLDTPNPQADAYFGFAVAVGDVDGDGKGDIAVGAPLEDVGGNAGQGRAYVFSGAPPHSLLFTLDTPNPQAWAHFGYSVAVGDVNGDGKVDIAVAAPDEDVGGNEDQGRAYVFSGTDGSLLFALDTSNAQVYAYFGSSLAVGDVNDDGRADIAVGAPEDVGGNEDQGRAYVFSGADGSLLFTLDSPSPQAHAYFGGSLAMGDVNGDGKADIAVGAYGEDVGGNEDQGRAYVFSGADGSLLFTLDTPTPQAHAAFGFSVAMGDVNGDGKADIAVGAYGEDVGGNVDQGRAYAFSGSDGSLLFTLNTPNPQANAYFGLSVAVGDVDGDGKGEIVVGAPNEDVGGNANQGRAYVFSCAGLSPALTLDTPNPQADAWFGWSVALGDVDGDGKADIAVGAPDEDVGVNADQGRVYVFSGADGSLLFTLDTRNPQAEGRFGETLAVGDFFGDGKAEIVVGAPYEDVGANPNQGRAYLVLFLDEPLVLWLDSPNPQESGDFGSSVAVGDVNGDGMAEIVVGAEGEAGTGRAYVFSGSSLLLTLPPPTR